MSRTLGLLRRFHQDGRLPPPTSRLLRDVVRVRVLRSAGLLRPGDVRRLDRRTTSGAVPASLHALGDALAIEVSDALACASVEHAVIAREGDGWTFALAAGDRAAAWEALSTLPGLQAALGRGTRSVRSQPGTRGAGALRARRATDWWVGRVWELGARRVGEGSAAHLTFWHLGGSGRLERLGVRGNARIEVDRVRTEEPVGNRLLPGVAGYPVASSLSRMTEPVDVVVTWVDDQDPRWQRSRDEHAHALRSLDASANHPARFRSLDELRYALRSVWLYAGWVRRIHLVTAGQRPAWLADDDRVRVVDHAQILEARHLPTFNSHVIESALHHVPDLAEHFVYLNDDVLLARSVRPETFFTPGGLPRVFLSDARIDAGAAGSDADVDTAARRGRALLAAQGLGVADRKPHHAPFVLRRSDLLELEQEFAGEFETTRTHRFRDPDDVSVPSGLAQQWALAHGRAVESDLDVAYVTVEARRLPAHLDRLLLADDVDAFCLNSTGVAELRESSRRRVERFLLTRFPDAAPWERRA